MGVRAQRLDLPAARELSLDVGQVALDTLRSLLGCDRDGCVDLRIGQPELRKSCPVHGTAPRVADVLAHPGTPLDVAERAVDADARDECHGRPLVLATLWRALGAPADEREDGRGYRRLVLGPDHGRDLSSLHYVLAQIRRARVFGESCERRTLRVRQRRDGADGAGDIRGAVRARCLVWSVHVWHMCGSGNRHRD